MRWMQNKTDNSINLTSSDILLGIFLVTAKMYIYYCKFKGTSPNLDGFMRRVINIKCTEKYISVRTTKHKFTIKNG